VSKLEKKLNKLEKKLWILVTSGCKEQGVRRGEDRLEVKLIAQPVKGEANKELMQVLSQFFGVPPAYIEIVKGARTNNKLISVTYKSI